MFHPFFIFANKHFLGLIKGVKSLLHYIMDKIRTLLDQFINYFNSPNNSIIATIIGTIIAALLVALITFIIRSIWKKLKEIKEIKSWKENELLNKLSGFSDDFYMDIVNSSLYIPVSGQKEAPNNDFELVPSDNRFVLEDKLLKKFFSSKKSLEKKRFLILGGSGMGKTIFMVSFLNKFINWYKFKKNPYPIYLMYLGKKSVIDEINKIDDSSKTQSIILLDALDENHSASENLENFMKELEEATSKFKYVIITCRTQFFTKEADELNKSSIWISGSKNRILSYEKIYISPFTEQESTDYLMNKYRVGSKEYRKALTILKNSGDLVSRPLILSFMDELLKLDLAEKLNLVEIYSVIVDSWFQRECEFQIYNKSELWDFSKQLAYFIYTKWDSNGEQFLSENDYKVFIENNGFKESPFSFKVRSLINRTNDGFIKFAHRSFWEFFLAIYSIENPGISFNPKGLDMAVKFAKEMYESILNESPYGFLNLPKPHINSLDNIFTPELKEQLDIILNKISKACNSKYSNIDSDLIDNYIYNYLDQLTMIMPQFFFNFYRLNVKIDKSYAYNGSCPQILKEALSINGIYLDYYKELLHSFLNEQIERIEIIKKINRYIRKRIVFEKKLSAILSELSFYEEMPISFYALQETLIYPYLLDYNEDMINKVLFCKYYIRIVNGLVDDKSTYKILDYFNKKISLSQKGRFTYIFIIEKHSNDLDEVVTFIKKIPATELVIFLKIIYDSTVLYFFEPKGAYLDDKLIPCRKDDGSIFYLPNIFYKNEFTDLTHEELKICLEKMLNAKKKFLNSQK